MNSRMSVSSCSSARRCRAASRTCNSGAILDGHLPRPGAGGRARCGCDRSCAARRPGSASRAGCRGRPARAIASPRPAALPERRPPPPRSRRIAGSPRRAPAARDRAAGARQRRRSDDVGHTSTGGALITSRTSIGMLSGTPPLPGAADTRAAICTRARWSRRRRSSSRRETPWPSANGPSVTSGAPSLPARTTLACLRSGQALGADQLAGLLQLLVEADHEADVRLDVFRRPRPNPGSRPTCAGACIINMYFMSMLLGSLAPSLARSWVSRSGPCALDRSLADAAWTTWRRLRPNILLPGQLPLSSPRALLPFESNRSRECGFAYACSQLEGDHGHEYLWFWTCRTLASSSALGPRSRRESACSRAHRYPMSAAESSARPCWPSAS